MHQTSSRELVLQRRARPGQRHRVWKWLWGTLLVITGTSVLAGEPNHGFAYFGELKYPADMAHFDYVNPNAPKGGTARVPGIGTFNNLHAFVDKGILPVFADPRLGGVLYEPLMRQSEDELGSYYGRLAELIEVADDISWVEYTLRRNARWHDGEPVKVEDVLWTFETIKTKGAATWRNAYRDIERIEQTGAWSFKFYFREEAEKTSQLVIQTVSFRPLPRHYWLERKFDATTLEPPLGNGPYRIASLDPGRSISYEKVPNYWANDLNVTVGHFNFDRLEVIYFFDNNVMLQAMRAGVFDYYRDQNENDFATAYDFEAYHAGLFKKETYTMGLSYGMHYGLVFNSRREPFDDIRVREALTLAYNFEWANRVYWHSGMDRNNSYFMRSGLQATGLPSAAELALLEPFREQLPARVFTHPVDLPKNKPSGRNRETLIQADALLKEAGWVVRDFKRVHASTGKPLVFEFIVSSGDFERMLVPYVDGLKRLGIETVLRKVEGNLMINRMRNYDFDMTIRKFYTYTIPFPSRMRAQFTSLYANQPNMINYAGISNPVVDALVEKVATADNEAAMNAAGQALDRVLLWNFYLIPDGHPVGRHLAYWDRFGHPPLGAENMNWTGFPYLWWFDEARNARVEAGIEALKESER